jgi:hypothetical protein
VSGLLTAVSVQVERGRLSPSTIPLIIRLTAYVRGHLEWFGFNADDEDIRRRLEGVETVCSAGHAPE